MVPFALRLELSGPAEGYKRNHRTRFCARNLKRAIIHPFCLTIMITVTQGLGTQADHANVRPAHHHPSAQRTLVLIDRNPRPAHLATETDMQPPAGSARLCRVVHPRRRLPMRSPAPAADAGADGGVGGVVANGARCGLHDHRGDGRRGRWVRRWRARQDGLHVRAQCCEPRRGCGQPHCQMDPSLNECGWHQRPSRRPRRQGPRTFALSTSHGRRPLVRASCTARRMPARRSTVDPLR
jgi:hypothetical protein